MNWFGYFFLRKAVAVHDFNGGCRFREVGSEQQREGGGTRRYPSAVENDGKLLQHTLEVPL